MEQAIQDYTNMVILCLGSIFLVLVSFIVITIIISLKNRKIMCSKCVRKIDKDSNFCKYCGDKIFKK